MDTYSAACVYIPIPSGPQPPHNNNIVKTEVCEMQRATKVDGLALGLRLGQRLGLGLL